MGAVVAAEEAAASAVPQATTDTITNLTAWAARSPTERELRQLAVLRGKTHKKNKEDETFADNNDFDAIQVDMAWGPGHALRVLEARRDAFEWTGVR